MLVQRDSSGLTAAAFPRPSSKSITNFACLHKFLRKGHFYFSARIIEIPVVQFVKESEGRGVRAKEDVDQSSVIGTSHWFVGFLASFMAGIIIVLVVQVVSSIFIRLLDRVHDNKFCFYFSGEIAFL